MTTKAGRWLRVSTKGQDEANQEPQVDKWIADRGYEVVETYRVHGQSAFHGDHEPDVRRAMADMASGKIEVLVIWKSDRIDRQEKLGALIKEANGYGGRLDFVTEPELNALNGLGGRVMTVIKEFVNWDESQTKSDRVKAKQAKLRRLGSFANGRPSHGYTITLTGEVREDVAMKTLVPNDRAPEVVRIFTEVAAGRSLAQVGLGLIEDGIEGIWHENTIARIIGNTIYRGLVQYNGVTYMTVEPIVSASLWLTANQALKARSKRPGRGGGRPLGAFLRPVCGECGAPMYRYEPSYRCSGFGPAGNSALRKGCGNTIKIDALDAEVLAEFEAADDPEIVETVTAGHDWSEEIAAAQLAIKDLDVMADDYDELHAALVTELRRLRGLPAEPPRRTAVFTGRTEGEAFKAMTEIEQRQFIRLWTLTVWPKGSGDRRWSLDRT